jgi:hypothetical protein
MEAVAEARSAHPDTYVAAEITRQRDVAGWVAFTEVPTEWVKESFDALPVRVEIREAPKAPTEIEQTAIVAAAHYAVLGAVGVADAASSIDPLTGQVEVDYAEYAWASRDSVARDAQQAARRAVSKAYRRGGAGAAPAVALTLRGELGRGTEALYGGAQLTKGGSDYCTSGFAVTSGTRQGIMTAEHCTPAMNYGSSTALTNRGALANSVGDIRWLSASDTAANRVHTSSTATKAITGSSCPVPGAVLSFYGRSTGASTDEVYKLGQCSGNYCGLTMTHRHKTSGGDSGGPWTFGGSAVGVHHGYKTYLLIERSLYTDVGIGAGHLGVTLKTS